MNILFITHHYLTSNGGGSFASRAYINAFAEIADAMTLLYPINDKENIFNGINPKVKLIPVKYNVPKWKKLYHQFVGKTHRYFEIAPKYINEGNFNLVVFDTSMVSFKLIDLAQKKDVKTIVIHHNYQYEYFRDNCRGVLRPLTLFWCKRYERQAVQKADVNLSLTPQDIDLLANTYNNGNKDNFSVLGTFEYIVNQSKYIDCNRKNSNRFVITGSLDSIQTYVSLKKWIDDYYVLLKSVFPESSLTIAGKKPSIELTFLCQQHGISIIASPPNMDEVLYNADYYICPTFLGGGLKLRIMDGLKWGLPVVTHVVSARGYDAFKDAGYLFSYSNAEEFIDTIQQLKSLIVSKQEIQNLYTSIFSFEAGVERLEDVLKKQQLLKNGEDKLA